MEFYDGRGGSVGRATARMVVLSAQFLGAKADRRLFSGLAGGAVSGGAPLAPPGARQSLI